MVDSAELKEQSCTVDDSAKQDHTQLHVDELYESTTTTKESNTSSSDSTKVQWNTTTVYVGGLHARIAQVHLEKLMKPYGITKRLHLCNKNGRHFAFCEYEQVEEARAAVKALHGRRLLRNTLSVRPAHKESKLGILRNEISKPLDINQERRAIEGKIEALKRKLGR
jgi:RNA recognition motif-containing protein